MHSIRMMTIADHDAVVRLMKETPGVMFRDADSQESTARYLQRNPGLSFVCEVDGQLVGCIMCGHDGRRGYLQHLIVLPAHRRKGIANALVESCVDELEKLGIFKSHVDVMKTNTLAAAYWESQGWKLRSDIDRFSLVRSGAANA
ncbi:MAG: GNAT family N-acetyltransferase [Polaromonas sp.]|uniref:GNAT family N-acetyltransferase n=1 Tax=Polaromonas sp. TaxID=1869339 RepID=UPI0025F4A9F9|nr:GNAT family N-acetyltransferase [Polaromonas sp.]MBI2725137.1 GNAT family N-acetyltransferase [Polaromonas sp.]